MKWQHSWVIGGYLLLAVLMSWPAALNLNNHLIGKGGDPWQTVWRFEQDFVLSEFLGVGDARLVNYSNLPWQWAHELAGEPLGYNIIWLLSFILSGYFMFLLVKYLTKSQEAAFIAGVYYMFLPYHAAHAGGHFGAMQTQWMPLLVLLLLRWVKSPGMGVTLWLGIVFAVQAWTEHHYALWFSVFAVIYVAWAAKNNRWSKPRKSAWLLVLLVGVFVVLPYWPTIQLAAESDALNLGQEQAERFSADLFGWVAPAKFHPVVGALIGWFPVNTGLRNVSETTHYLGLVPLLLVIFFHQKIPKGQKKLWVWVAIVFGILALGPRLYIWGRATPVLLPYALLDNLPVFSAVRAVGRAAVLLNLAVTVLLGWVIATQVRRRWVYGLLTGLILFEFLFMPMSLQAWNFSNVYAVVEDLPGRSLVEIPAVTNYTAASKSLYASNFHGKEVVGNIALERNAEKGRDEVKSLPALRQLVTLKTGDLRPGYPDFFNQKLTETLPDVLRYLDTHGIVVHSDSLTRLQRDAVDRFLLVGIGMERREFGDAVLYSAHREGDGVFLSRDGQWEGVRYDAESDSVHAELFREARVKLFNVTNEVKTVRLEMQVADGSHGSFCVDQESERVADFMENQGSVLGFEVELVPGETDLTFKNKLTETVRLRDLRMEVK